MNTKPSPSPSPAILAEAKRQHAILIAGVEAVYPAKGVHGPDGLFDKLVVALMEKRPLRIKFGMDPTAPDIHLGHTVVLNALRKFQNLGHVALPLIGNYTALIGDPSGRNSTRPPLTEEQIMSNATTYLEQIYKVVDQDPAKCQLMWNGDWLAKLTFAETIKLCAQVTVAQITAREDFAKRLEANEPISMHELLYPIMQGYDSVCMDERGGCDIEFGGTDQTFNCLMGRQLMSARGQTPQIVMTFPLLEGLDGVAKMSKSKNNYIGVEETPENMFGKTMSVPDILLERWFVLLTDILPNERAKHPMEAKRQLARFITNRFHSLEGAIKGEDAFNRRSVDKELPEEIFNFEIPAEFKNNSLKDKITILDVILMLGFVDTKSEAKRRIMAKGLKINREFETDFKLEFQGITDPFILEYGKRSVARVSISELSIPSNLHSKFDEVESRLNKAKSLKNNEDGFDIYYSFIALYELQEIFDDLWSTVTPFYNYDSKSFSLGHNKNIDLKKIFGSTIDWYDKINEILRRRLEIVHKIRDSEYDKKLFDKADVEIMRLLLEKISDDYISYSFNYMKKLKFTAHNFYLCAGSHKLKDLFRP